MKRKRHLQIHWQLWTDSDRWKWRKQHHLQVHWQLWTDSDRWKWRGKNTTIRFIGNCGQTQTGENEGKNTPPSDSLATVDRLRQVKMKTNKHHLQIHWQLWTDSDRWKWWGEKPTFRFIGNCGQTQTGENERRKTPPSDSLATVDRLRQVKMKNTFRFIGNCGQTQTGENEKMKKTTFRSIGNCGQTQAEMEEKNATFRFTGNCGQTQTGDLLAIVDRLKQVEVGRKCHL